MTRTSRAAAGALLAVALAACRSRPVDPGEDPVKQSLDAAWSAIGASDVDAAIAELDAALAGSPDSAELWKLRAHCHVRQREFDAALLDFDRAVSLAPDDSWTHYARGVALHECGRLEHAITSLTRALELDPCSYKAAEHRAYVRALTGDHSAAIADFSRALELAPRDDPDRSWILFQRGESYAALGDHASADRDRDAARGAAPIAP